MLPTLAEPIGVRVARLREAKGFTGRSLAEATKAFDATGKGLSHSYVQKLEQGHIKSPGAQALALIAAALGLDGAADLLGHEAAAPVGVEERMRAIAREEAQKHMAPRVVTPTDDVVPIRVYAEASATAGGQSARVIDVVDVPRSWTQGKQLIAVKIVGRCMHPYLLPDDIVFFEKIDPSFIRDGDQVLVTILSQEEDGAHQVKYLTWG